MILLVRDSWFNSIVAADCLLKLECDNISWVFVGVDVTACMTYAKKNVMYVILD